jgi:hypothetical protein
MWASRGAKPRSGGGALSRYGVSAGPARLRVACPWRAALIRRFDVLKERLIVVVSVLMLGILLAPGAHAAEERCTEERVQALVSQFIDAFNTGDVQRLEALFAASPDFRWFVVDRYTHWDRATLVRYFEQERSNGVELRLTRFRFIGYSDGYGHFEFELVRTTRQGPLRYHGKGASLCRSDKPDVIAVWGMGLGSGPAIRHPRQDELNRVVRSVHRQARRRSRSAQLP